MTTTTRKAPRHRADVYVSPWVDPCNVNAFHIAHKTETGRARPISIAAYPHEGGRATLVGLNLTVEQAQALATDLLDACAVAT